MSAPQSWNAETAVHTLRHFVSALEYRTEKVFDGCPEGFCKFSAGHGVRSPVEILAHMSEVLAFAREAVGGAPRVALPIRSWAHETERFRETTATLRTAIASWADPQPDICDRLLQGPLSDAMTHSGQLATLRRMKGAPIEGENFFAADIGEDE